MEGIAIVAFLVTCSPDYLHCQPLNTEGRSWRDPAACDAEVSRLVRDYRGEGHRNVMGKCQYIIPGEARRRAFG